MGFYPHVKKGDKVRPSASLENAKRDLVNRFQGIAKSGNKARITSVAVYNATDTKITAYSAVTLARDKVIQDIIPIAATSVKGDQIFGIVLDAIESGKVGYAAIDGITNAQVTIRSNLHKYAVAGPGGKLESADSGPVMLCGRYDAASKQIVCLVKLSSGTHEPGYTGDFQIIAKADGGFVIADGNSWNGSRSAGSKCIINGREITVDDYSLSSGTAYLVIDFSAILEGGDPTATLAQTKNSGEHYVNIPIAEVVDDTPKQIYQGGIFIYERASIRRIHRKLSPFFEIKNGELQAATDVTPGVLEYDPYNGLRTTPTTKLPDEVRENGIG